MDLVILEKICLPILYLWIWILLDEVDFLKIVDILLMTNEYIKSIVHYDLNSTAHEFQKMEKQNQKMSLG